MGIEGSIDIQMSKQLNGLNAIDIQSTRPVYASQVFHGKRINEALTMLPLLFSICGVAQSCAGVRACEQALGLEVSERVEHARNQLVNMETLREHLWRILLDWPAFIDSGMNDQALTAEQASKPLSQTREMSEIIKYQQSYRQLLTAGNNPFLMAPELSVVSTKDSQPIIAINQLLEGAIFAMSPEKWLAIDSIEQLQDWFESCETIAACFLRRVHKNQWQGLGHNQVEGLYSSSMDVLDIDELYTQFEAESFIKQPQWRNKCYETSSLTRVESPLLNDLKLQWGNGLMSRLVARLTEMAQLAQGLMNDTDHSVNYVGQTQSKYPSNGVGIVSAARGLLIHRVSIEQEHIRQYQILAPTEWNFHPQGVVTQSLASLQGDSGKIRQQAEMLINAIDPCVGYQFHVQ